MRKIFNIFALIAVAIIVATVIQSCARMRQPDGGWYDEVPPRVVGASPAERSTHVSSNKIEIRFSEYVKLENASENVVICPPQLEQPEISTKSKSVIIELKDTLKDNTTYTIDFSDAISDFRESNSMDNYTFTFSTGEVIDTLACSGYIVDAETLEPIEGILVGLHSNHEDSTFTTKPLERIGRTDGSGHFSIRGIAPGKYRIYALQDGDNNFMLSQRGERLAFSHDIIEPSCRPDTRQDTTWIDSLRIGSIDRVPYTRFLPDDICLRAFTQKLKDRYLVKSERKDPDRFSVVFSYGSDKMPELRALNFNDSAAYVIESSIERDSITYWLRDTALINQDTLRIEMTYMMNDSLGNLIEQTDTLDMMPKEPYAKRKKKLDDEMAKWEKKAEKARKKGKEPQEPMPIKTKLEAKLDVPQRMTPVQNILLKFDTPLERLDTAAIHLYSKIDTLWYNSPVEIKDEGLPPRTYEIRGEWRPGTEYSLEIDSAAFVDIYGKVSDAIKKGIMVANDEEFSSLFVNMRGIDKYITNGDSTKVIVRLLDNGGKLAAESVAEKNTAEFYYIKPGTYYLSALIDRNGNGKWDTGDYSLDEQPEYIFYSPKEIECKAKWDLTTEFNVQQLPFNRQKPEKLVQQKEKKKKAIMQKNMKRAQELSIPYDREKVNSKF